MAETIDLIAHEAMLFAAIGLLIGGLDDWLVDAMYLGRRMRRRGVPIPMIDDLPAVTAPGRIVVFVPAWDEEPVIGAMLTTALARFCHPDYRIHVGLYPNDPATIAAVRSVAAGDQRVIPVVGPRPGPTTKADCLNSLWRALGNERLRIKAIILHDAEDLVHPDELRLFDAMIGDHAAVQLPVVPLIGRGSISATYADDFAQAHANHMVIRTALGAGMPLAGTGCAIKTSVLAELDAARGGEGPFDPDSLVEDYELGLRITALGHTSIFARITDADGAMIAVRAFFPDTLAAAVRQRTRWITGIALAGWDRAGWGKPLALAENWFRARDRRTPLAMLVLAAAYAAMLLWLASAGLHYWNATPVPSLSPPLGGLLAVNTALLLWRLAMRAGFTAAAYGWRQGLFSVPRLVVGNVVALLAAARAIWRYLGMARGATPVWEKTAHRFPGASA